MGNCFPHDAFDSGQFDDFEHLPRGRYLQRLWTAEDFHTLASGPILIQIDSPVLRLPQVEDCLQRVLLKIGHGRFKAESTEKIPILKIWVAEANAGDACGRMCCGELGAGHAYLQLEGRMLAANQKEELAVFCDRARHSGNIGLDDIGGDAGPRLIESLCEELCDHLIRDLFPSKTAH